MPPKLVSVTASSRLHFGMLSFGQPGERQFGGVGAMIDRPGVRLELRPAERFTVPPGALAERAEQFARQACERLGVALLNCELELPAAPPEHVGLGVGTQLGLAVAAGLNAFLGRPPLSTPELARAAGRGARSAIGTYGFAQGGLLVEAGKTSEQLLSPLLARVELPPDWRFVLITPRGRLGLSGEAEQQAFATIPPVPAQTTAELCHEALLHLLPAAVEADFDEFSRSLFRFGRLAGSCFAGKQGGPFGNPQSAWLVETIRSLGVPGVGQSSWGPTLFALLPNEQAASQFAARLTNECGQVELDITISAPASTGAQISIEA